MAEAKTSSVKSMVLPPLVLAKIVDTLTAGTPAAFGQVLLYFGLLALTGLLESARGSLLTVFGQKITHGLRSCMMAKLPRLSSGALAAREPGELVSRFVGDVDTVENLFSAGIISMFADLCKIVSILIVLSRKNPGLCLVLLPFVLRRLPLPEALVSRKTLLCLGTDLALLLALLGVCCVYAGGDWFWITAVSVIFAAAVLLLPFVLKQLPLPEALRRHSAALWLGTVSLLLFVLLGAACLYDGGDWFLLPALPMAVYGLLLPWGVLVLARYLRAGGWFRAAAAFGFTAVWYWLFPWVLDRVMALDGRFMDPSYSLLRPFGFDLAHWDAAGTASNVMMLILAALILIALVLAAVGMLRRRK